MMPPSTSSTAVGIIEHRRRPEADADDVDAALGQPADQRRPPAPASSPARRGRPRPWRRRRAADQGAEAAADRIGVGRRPASFRRSRECHIRAARSGGRCGSTQAPSGHAALQLLDQRVARRIDPGCKLGRAAGVGMDLGDQPPVRLAYLLEAGALARRRAGRAPRPAASPRCAPRAAPPHIDHAREHRGRGRSCRSARHRRLARRGVAPPGSGRARPAIISRNSCRAAICETADVARSAWRSSRVRPLGKSSR